MSYNHLYKFEEAIEDATKAIEKDITLAEAYVSRGIAKFFQKMKVLHKKTSNTQESLAMSL